MPFCASCGNEVKDGAKFCGSCGAAAGGAPAPAPAPASADIPQKLPAGRKTNVVGIVVGIAAGFVALIIIILAATVMPKFMAEQTLERGNRLLIDGKYNEAITAFYKAIKQYPKHDYAYAYRLRGDAYSYKKEYDNAIADFNKSIELDSNDWQAYKSRGGAYYNDWMTCAKRGTLKVCEEKRDYTRIIADFNKSIELNPDYADKLPEIKALPPKSVRNKDDKLRLIAFITDSVMTLGAKGGFMPSLFYKEFHRYIAKEGGLDTLIEYVPDGPRPKHPRSGRELTIHERYEIYLYTTDENRNVIKSMYTKSGEMLTNEEGNPVESVNVGDTVYALANPRWRIVVTNPTEFESKPLSAYDELTNRLMKVKERYRDAADADDIIIAAENGVIYDKIIPIVYAARIAEFPNIDIAVLRDYRSVTGLAAGGVFF